MSDKGFELTHSGGKCKGGMMWMDTENLSSESALGSSSSIAR